MSQAEVRTKFCKFCGAKIAENAVICMHCGGQVEELRSAQPNVVINNSNMSSNTNTNTNINNAQVYKKVLNKWVAFLLCFFLGYLGDNNLQASF